VGGITRNPRRRRRPAAGTGPGRSPSLRSAIVQFWAIACCAGARVIRPARTAFFSATGGSPLFMLGDMTIQRMDNVAIVVEDLDAAVAFFTELGMELDGKGQVEGLWADRTVGLDGVRSDIAMMRTPDGHSKLELTKYHTPAASGAEPENPPPNTLGLHRVMFAVDDIDDTIARLRAHGAELLGDVAQYESIFRLCFLRVPAGIIVALAEQIG
jgi:catechol 2,3-dioxygenase-like lactoylglutathione lyase family enzyme